MTHRDRRPTAAARGALAGLSGGWRSRYPKTSCRSSAYKAVSGVISGAQNSLMKARLSLPSLRPGNRVFIAHCRG